MDKIKKELWRFFVVGCGAVGTDTLVYFVLVNFTAPSMAKATSFTAGAIVAYVLGKYWTFEQKKKSYSEAVRFVILYVLTLVANVLVNKGVLSISSTETGRIVAFLCATGTSTILNFIGQKFWVFCPPSIKK